MNFDRAMQQMKKGARLILTHTEEGDKWDVEPGGWILPVPAQHILSNPNVRPEPDSLLVDELPQSWRLVESEAA